MLASVLYKNNQLYRQLSFKWKCFSHLNYYLKYVSTRYSLSPSARIAYLLFLIFVLYLTDVVCGCICYRFIQDTVVKQLLLKSVSGYTLSMLQWTKNIVRWIMGTPGGLKLNTPLNHFIGGRILALLDLWQYFYSDFIAMYLDSILSVLLILLPFGLTLFLAAVHDFLKFLHLCLICFFVFTSCIVGLQVSVLKSLTRLFMGSKWNVLRKRIDSCDYDTNQLLVGTIMFTSLLFLLPTTGAYFLLFLALRLFQFFLQFVLRAIVVMMNSCIIKAASYFCFLLNEKPLTQLKANVTLCGDVRMPVQVQCVFNSKQYSARKIRSIIDSTPITNILQAVSGKGSQLDFDDLNHPMQDLLAYYVHRDFGLDLCYLYS